MVLETLKKYIPNYNSKYPRNFQKILEAFSEEYNLIDEDIDLFKELKF